MSLKTTLTLSLACLVCLPAAAQNTSTSPAPATRACADYVDRGQSGWFVNHEDKIALRIVPTACGRLIGPDDTPHMFYEIVKTFGDPEDLGSVPSPGDRWKNVKGMINQLTCHLRIARDKPEWNLEPYRPWVGDGDTEATGCNPRA